MSFDQTKTDLALVLKISKELREWFTPVALKNIENDFQSKNVLKLYEGRALSAFVIFAQNAEEIEILWLAVKKDRQREGLGKKLLCELENIANKAAINRITTITLDESIAYLPYDATRKFYLSLGFKPLKVIKNYWGTKDHALFMEKRIPVLEKQPASPRKL